MKLNSLRLISFGIFRCPYQMNDFKLNMMSKV
jgi:hypothetical protein